jgi:oxalate decarboxylase/phosphoglucose isomerase-like protein (cupin superfamily)
MNGRAFGPLVTPLAVRTHDEMKPVLMAPDSEGPAIHYYMIRGGVEQKNVTVWSPGTVGGEYIKAFGHYHRDSFIETYTVVSGVGIMLLQEHKEGAIDEVVSIKAIRVQPGSVIDIPPHTGHLLVNTGNEWLVTVDNSPVEQSNTESAWPKHADYESVKAMRGFAYYVVAENGTPAFIKNTLYKVIPDIEII